LLALIHTTSVAGTIHAADVARYHSRRARNRKLSAVDQRLEIMAADEMDCKKCERADPVHSTRCWKKAGAVVSVSKGSLRRGSYDSLFGMKATPTENDSVDETHLLPSHV
jgi:hypothetical protein